MVEFYQINIQMEPAFLSLFVCRIFVWNWCAISSSSAPVRQPPDQPRYEVR